MRSFKKISAEYYRLIPFLSDLLEAATVPIINIIFSVYNIAWLITGSIIFWGYCKNLEPENINILMYFSLILGYIGFFNQITFLNKNFENKKKDQKPLLDL